DQDEAFGGVERLGEAADDELLGAAPEEVVEDAAEDEAAGGAHAGPAHDDGGDAQLTDGAEDALGGVGVQAGDGDGGDVGGGGVGDGGAEHFLARGDLGGGVVAVLDDGEGVDGLVGLAFADHEGEVHDGGRGLGVA